MPAFATCKFPLVDKWKAAADKNPVLDTVDCVLSGLGQIVFCDNPFTALIILTASLIYSIPLCVSILVTSFAAAIFCKLLKVPGIPCRIGLYNFAPSLAGMGVAMLIFPGQEVSIYMIVLNIICAIFCVLLTACFSSFFSNWNVSSFSIPVCMVFLIVLPASLYFTKFPIVATSAPYLGVLVDAAAAGGPWTLSAFSTAFMSNFSQMIFQSDPKIGAMVLVGLLCASRIDFCSAIVASLFATVISIGLGLPQGGIMAGAYGFNAIFIMLALFGRSYAMSVKSFIFALLCSGSSVVLFACLGTLLAPLGVPIATLPFGIIGLIAMLAKDVFTDLKFVAPMYWGVPETIAQMLKNQTPEESDSNS